MMKKIRYIFLSMMMALSFASCQKELLEPVGSGDVPEGYVKVVIDMAQDFGTQEVTTRSGERAGDPMIATTREMGISNAFVCVFAHSATPADDLLLQYEPVIRDFDASGNPHYYAVLEEVDAPVMIHGLSNIDDETVVKITAKVNDKYTITREKFYALEIPYSADSDSPILKNQDGALLPKFTEPMTLTALNTTTIKLEQARTRFSYTRVDVVMPVGSEYPKILGLSATNVPTLPPRGAESVKVKSHEVTPLTNQPAFGETVDERKWPTGISSVNESTKYVQGLYMYYNNRLPSGATAPQTPIAEEDAIELIIRAQRDEDSPADGTYYKILLRYKIDPASEYSYDTYTSNRYLVNVHALNSAGYATWEEAADAPPANVHYDINIDGISTSYVTNGQYYIGSGKAELIAEGKSQSNMMYTDPQIIEFTHKSDESWTINADGTLGVDLVFSYNAGEGSSISVSDLTKEIVLPDGVEYDDAAGYYDNSTNWDNSFGIKKLRLKVTKGYVSSDIKIKLGELTHKVKFMAKGEIYTDYTDIEFIKELTNLDYTYGGVPAGQVRLANSYILAPMETTPTAYYIPVGERINEFWRSADYAGTSATDIYSDLLTTNWTNNTNYSVELSWYDGADIDDLVVQKAYSPAGKNAIKVTLPPSFKHQNIAVNVKYGTDIIWSWHLWVTDYNPYFVTLKENSNSAAAYPERNKLDQNQRMAGDGNALHSYSGTIWSSGIYADKFIMDRNLGGLSANFAGYGGTTSGKGAIFFQFGRKDPFPRKAGLATENGQKSFADVVNNPNVFITNTTTINWCNETNAQLTTILWNDKNVPIDGYSIGKSIFDPSPVGFRLPIQGTWELFATSNSPWSNLSTTQYSYGRLYNEFVYYPASGYLERENASLGWINAEGSNWSSSPNSSSEGRRLAFNNGLMDPNRVITRTYGFPVRPIQE